MNVLVIGGTRFMGPLVIQQLVRDGHSVTAFHRGPGRANLAVDIPHIHGDRRRLPDYRDVLRAARPDVVLDMVAMTEQDARHLVDVFRGVAARVVAVSSQDVYRAYGRLIGTEPGPPDAIPLSENGPLRERLYPFRSEEPLPPDAPRPWGHDVDKILVERAVMSAPDLPGTVVRLPAVYGPNDGQHRLFPYVKRMDDNRPAILMSPEQAAFRWSRGYVEDMAAALVLAVTRPEAAGRVYNAAEEDPLPEAEWVRRIGHALGWRGEVVEAPAERLPEPLKDGAHFQHHLVVNTARIRAELGYAEPTPPEDALRRAIAWERDSPPAEPEPDAFDYAAEDAALA